MLVEASVTPVFGEKRHLTGHIVVMHDITRQTKAKDVQIDINSLLKEEIERRKKIELDLIASNAELDAFASAASHDLQEPLRMVVSYLQLIERRYANLFDDDNYIHIIGISKDCMYGLLL